MISAVSSTPVRDLTAVRWLDAGQSVIPCGPVGFGKTHVAQAMGQNVIRRDGQVRVLTTSRVLTNLAGGHADRTWERRLREYTRSVVLILDDIAIRELSAPQAERTGFRTSRSNPTTDPHLEQSRTHRLVRPLSASEMGNQDPF